MEEVKNLKDVVRMSRTSSSLNQESVRKLHDILDASYVKMVAIRLVLETWCDPNNLAAQRHWIIVSNEEEQTGPTGN